MPYYGLDEHMLNTIFLSDGTPLGDATPKAVFDEALMHQNKSKSLTDFLLHCVDVNAPNVRAGYSDAIER
jgi:hypothetical protein